MHAVKMEEAPTQEQETSSVALAGGSAFGDGRCGKAQRLMGPTTRPGTPSFLIPDPDHLPGRVGLSVWTLHRVPHATPAFLMGHWLAASASPTGVGRPVVPIPPSTPERKAAPSDSDRILMSGGAPGVPHGETLMSKDSTGGRGTPQREWSRRVGLGQGGFHPLGPVLPSGLHRSKRMSQTPQCLQC
jgi:hypothetical protein